MKLNELILIKNALDAIYETNKTLPGGFEIKARSIMARIQPEQQHLLAMARKELDKDAGDTQKVVECANRLLEKYSDLELGVTLPKFTEDELRGVLLPRGAYNALLPVIENAEQQIEGLTRNSCLAAAVADDRKGE